jgi:alpha-L-fucosidase
MKKPRKSPSTPRLWAVATMLLSVLPCLPAAVQDPTEGSLNKQDRLEWFRDQGFGLFIHWNVDCQLGSVISHALVGASGDFCRRYFEELPGTFDPSKFRPGDWADLAKLAGVRYVVLTTKHHAGFCLWPTDTTDFNVARTPFRRDITGEVFEAFRKRGIAAGVYFSPDDFHWLWEHGIPIQRSIQSVQPSANPGLLDLDRRQLRELMTKYGPVAMVFFDGEAKGLRELAWELQPETVVTRGAIPTPEQNIPGLPLPGAWESCMTMGHGWGYQPTLEQYKSGADCISLLVETRAKGGNLLLNVGPKPDGELPEEQQERLREIALWMFVNHECIHAVRPWIITNEGNIWFTKKKDDGTLYAIVKHNGDWPDGAWKEFVLRSVRATSSTEISILGQNDEAMEYRPDVRPKASFQQQKDGLHVRAMHTQRFRDDRKWPNPIVLKITQAEPAFNPPRIETGTIRLDPAIKGARCSGSSSAATPPIPVSFEYRDITGLDTHDRSLPWKALPAVMPAAGGEFEVAAPGLASGHTYEFRAVARHPLLTVYGKTVTLAVP